MLLSPYYQVLFAMLACVLCRASRNHCTLMERLFCRRRWNGKPQGQEAEETSREEAPTSIGSCGSACSEYRQPLQPILASPAYSGMPSPFCLRSATNSATSLNHSPTAHPVHVNQLSFSVGGSYHVQWVSGVGVLLWLESACMTWLMITAQGWRLVCAESDFRRFSLVSFAVCFVRNSLSAHMRVEIGGSPHGNVQGRWAIALAIRQLQWQ
jgi:hypothetical protein